MHHAASAFAPAASILLATVAVSCSALGIKEQGLAHEVPAFNYVDVRGCGNFVLFAVSSDRREYLVVHANRKQLGLSSVDSWFDLAAPPEGLAVKIDVYPRPPEAEEPYCSDCVDDEEVQAQTWKAYCGKLRISLTGFREPEAGASQSEYWAHVRLEYAAFQAASGEVVRLRSALEFDGEVGSMNG